MRLTLFGSGYVGLVTAACFADRGNHVVCVDTDRAKVRALRRGRLPFYEPGLAELVRRNARGGRLRFTTDAAEGVAHGTLIFIAVGTPQDADGSADLSQVLEVARTIGRHLDGYRVVVDKSTVPVGTADRVRAEIRAELRRRKARHDFDVVSNPEFLKEGAAVDDFMKPDRIVIGADTARPLKLMRELYAPFNRNHDKLIVMKARSAELTKYAANAMLATRISLMNEVANIAEEVGADVEQVRIGIGSDSRIGFQFIYAGCGYGGSCFPKDVKALASTAEGAGYEPELVRSVDALNQRQKQRFYDKVRRYFGGRLAGRRMGELLGGKGRVLMLRYQEGSAATEERERGFLDELRSGFPEIEVVSSDQYAGATRDTAKRTSENLLNRFASSVNGIFTPNESSTAGMLLALQDIGKAGAITFVGFDYSSAFIEPLKRGELKGFIVQNPVNMGYLSVKTMADHLQGRPVPKTVDTGVLLVTAENLTSAEVQKVIGGP